MRAQISPPRFNQRSIFPPQVQWGRSTHKTRKFKKVTHCLFDMDGTVIDSETQYHKILKELCAKYGKIYTKEMAFKNFGATDKQIAENVVKDLQLNMSATDLMKELHAMTKTRLPKAPLKKGVERLMKHLLRSGVLFAMATNSTRKDVRLHVATKPKIFGMFHHMVCADDSDVDRGKPFPDLYLVAASKFPDKPLPVKCLVFEDTLVGLEAGLAAGMQWNRSTHRTRKFKKVTHCLFDMDGTVIDSETQYHEILKELCAKYGKKYTKEMTSKNFGATDKEISEKVVKDLQLNMSATDLRKELHPMTKTRLPKAPLKKGVERLMKHLLRSGVLFAMATNSTRKHVTLHVATKPKIFGMFHHMVCSGDPDVDHGKPFPDLYLVAASKFPDKPLPVKCLVFEDSLVGLEAGLAAGMQVVMTPPRSLPVKDCAAATLVLESLLDFEPELFGLPPFTDDVKKIF